MNKWENGWIVVQRDRSGISGSLSDWYILLSDGNKIQGYAKIIGYLNQLGEQGWEQVSTLGEHYAEGHFLKSIYIFLKRPKP